MNQNERKELEKQFEAHIQKCLEISLKDFGYNPTRFKKMRDDYGSFLKAIKKLLKDEQDKLSDKFIDIIMSKRFELTMEYNALKKFPELFTDDELYECRKRLSDWGYKE